LDDMMAGLVGEDDKLGRGFVDIGSVKLIESAGIF
jgi:hypothetical protein